MDDLRRYIEGNSIPSPTARLLDMYHSQTSNQART